MEKGLLNLIGFAFIGTMLFGFGCFVIGYTIRQTALERIKVWHGRENPMDTRGIRLIELGGSIAIEAVGGFLLMFLYAMHHY